MILVQQYGSLFTPSGQIVRVGDGSIEFKRGKSTPVGIAVWDGGDLNVGGRKAVSTWYYVVPES